MTLNNGRMQLKDIDSVIKDPSILACVFELLVQGIITTEEGAALLNADLMYPLSIALSVVEVLSDMSREDIESLLSLNWDWNEPDWDDLAEYGLMLIDEYGISLSLKEGETRNTLF